MFPFFIKEVKLLTGMGYKNWNAWTGWLCQFLRDCMCSKLMGLHFQKFFACVTWELISHLSPM